MEQVNKKALDNASKPNTISPTPFAPIKNPMPATAATMVFFLVNRDRNSIRKRNITWNIAQNIDMSRSIVISSIHPLKQHLLIAFFYLCIISSGHGNLFPGNCQLRAAHALHLVYVDDKTLMAALESIPTYLPFKIV